MKVLVACEFSAIVRDAFRARGHDAFDRRIVESKQSQPADFLQSMEILMRRAHEQGKLR